MLKWMKENIGKALSICSFIFLIIGFIIGMYVTQLKLGTEIELLSDKIDLIKQWIHTAR